MKKQKFHNKTLINYKGKISKILHCKMGETHRNYLIQVIKINITSNGTNWHHVFLVGCPEKNTLTSVVYLLKVHNLILIMRNQYSNPNRNRLQNSWPVLFKDVIVIKPKGGLRTDSRLKDAKGIGYLNATYKLVFNCYQGNYWDR